jgi:hypothetical protein
MSQLPVSLMLVKREIHLKIGHQMEMKISLIQLQIDSKANKFQD